MNFNTYKNNVKNKFLLDSPNYLKQSLINKIINEKIGKYGTKQEENIINLTNMSQNEKIDICLEKNNKVFQLIDKLEMERGYKYSIVLYYKKEGLVDNLIKILQKNINAKNIESDYYNFYGQDINMEDEILYYEDENHLYLKFHKSLDMIDKIKVTKEYFRYPIIFVFHKKLNIFECRFDKLAHNGDYDFYLITLKARLSKIQNLLNFEYGYLELETIIKYIVDNEKEFVKEIVWSFETAKSKGLTLKVGEDGIMPFIGEVEPLLRDLENKYRDSPEAMECLSTINEYIYGMKRFSDEKFRILSMQNNKFYNENGEVIKEPLEKSIDFKISFSYSKNEFDLINIYEIEINDMERINNVISFIGKVGKDIREF